MAEEFQESEVVFPEDYSSGDNDELRYRFQADSRRETMRNTSSKAKRKKKSKSKKITPSSLPVNIPENVSRDSWFGYVDSDYLFDDEDDEIVPPHVIVGRRVAGKMMAFSVCTGIGRTLKGRDLSEVRNSILRMTGFLET